MNVSTNELGGLRVRGSSVTTLSGMNAKVIAAGSLNMSLAKSKLNIVGELKDPLTSCSLITTLLVLEKQFGNPFQY